MNTLLGGLTRFLVRAAIAAGCYTLAAIAPAAPPPPSVFGRSPALTDVSLSPNGKRLVWAESVHDAPVVVIYDLDQKKQLRKFAVGDVLKLRDMRWADDETVLVTVSQVRQFSDKQNDKFEYWRTQAVDVAGGGARTLLLDDNALREDYVTGARLINTKTTIPHSVIMSSVDITAAKDLFAVDSRIKRGRRDSSWVNSVFLVDTQTGKGKRLAAGSPYTFDWVVDHAGKVVARTDWDPEQSIYRILAKDGGGWREIYTATNREGLDVVALSADGTFLYALGANGRANRKLWRLPLDGGGAQIEFEEPNGDVENVLLNGNTNLPIGVYVGGAGNELRWLDQSARKQYEALQKAFPAKIVQTYGRSADGKRLLAHVSGPSQVPTYYLIDFAAGKADTIGEEYPELVDVPLGEVRTISYRARDGYEIPGYLTLPPGKEPTNLSLIVLPHGGPESRDYLDFDWLTQFFASRGYAVLQPQFRGSTGFGEAHRKAGYQQWGKLMQDDVTDGVRWVAEQGIVDSRRVCIAGWSYGGYAALAGAAFTPDLYRCAISINGVSDLLVMLGTTQRRAGRDSDALDYWYDHIGKTSNPDVIGRSPARNVEKIRAPTLLLHGTDDAVVPVLQSRIMATALKERGKAVELIELPGEDHWLSRSDTRTRVLNEIDRFLAETLPASAAN
ncbi:MAG: S9 family peptidase [Pseudomonadales bacterium]|nr:S9 family peptidase [Pseudomonadales bacterium]